MNVQTGPPREKNRLLRQCCRGVASIPFEGLLLAPYQAGLMACILLGRPRKAEVCWDVRSGCDTELALLQADGSGVL